MASLPSQIVVDSPEKRREELVKQVSGMAIMIRSLEIAIGELNHLAPSRTVYQKNANIFFQKDIKLTIAAEQKQLDLAKAELQKLDAV